jgi:hypothetical protein
MSTGSFAQAMPRKIDSGHVQIKTTEKLKDLAQSANVFSESMDDEKLAPRA